MHGYDFYRTQAARFRSLAEDSDHATARSLLMLAEDYEAEALRLEKDGHAVIKPPMPKPE